MGKLFVYGRSSCPFCLRAKALLERANQAHEFIDLEDNRPLLQKVKDMANWPTVPVVLLKEGETFQVIGGSEELERYLGN